MSDPISGYVGVDFAHYTPIVIPEKLTTNNVNIAIIKADDKFRENATKCVDAGMSVAAYHWCDPTESVSSQVNRTLEIVDGIPIFGIMGDVEHYWKLWTEWYAVYIYKTLSWAAMQKLSPSAISNNARDVMGEFSRTYYTFGYSSKNFIDTYCRPDIDNWINNYKWVMAHYRYQPSSGTYYSWQDIFSNWLPDYEPLYPSSLNRQNLIGHQFTGDSFAVDGLYQIYYGDGDSRNKYALADINVFDKAWCDENVKRLPNLNIPTEPYIMSGHNGNEKVVFTRTPDGEDINKFDLWYDPTRENILLVGEVPEFRYHLQEDGTYNEVPNWTTDEQRIAIQKDWAIAIPQKVYNLNGVEKQLPDDFEQTGKPWDVQGCYVLWSDLEKYSGENMDILYEGTVVATAGINIREGAASTYPKLTTRGAIPYGSAIKATEKAMDTSGNEWLHIVSVDGVATDGWSASTWNGYQTIEYSEITPPPTGGCEVIMVSFDAVLMDTGTNETWTQSWTRE